MKKLVSTLTILICLLMVAPAAQAQLKFGVKGGLNVSSLSFSKDVFSGENRTGFFIGPMAELTVPLLGLGLDAAALYNQSGAKSDIFDDKVKSIEIPVNVKWTFGLGSTAGIYVAAGPQFGFNVGDGSIGNGNYRLDMKDKYTTFNVGAGVKLIRHLQMGVNYNFGTSKMAKGWDEDSNLIEIKKNTWQISLAYLF